MKQKTILQGSRLPIEYCKTNILRLMIHYSYTLLLLFIVSEQINCSVFNPHLSQPICCKAVLHRTYYVVVLKTILAILGLEPSRHLSAFRDDHCKKYELSGLPQASTTTHNLATQLNNLISFFYTLLFFILSQPYSVNNSVNKNGRESSSSLDQGIIITISRLYTTC